MKAIMNLARRMELERFNGLMEVHTLGNFTVIIYTEWGYIHGKINESMKASGERIKCMEMARSSGQMVADMLANMSKIKNKVMVNSFGQTEDNTGENG